MSILSADGLLQLKEVLKSTLRKVPVQPGTGMLANASETAYRRHAAKWAHAWLCLLRKEAPSTIVTKAESAPHWTELPRFNSSTATHSVTAQIVMGNFSHYPAAASRKRNS
jgi:hypothetical protein